MKKLLEKIHLPRWLEILLAVILILRIPSFFEPFSYGDEMIYLTLGEGIKKGLILYKQIHDNKPPLLYLTAAVAGNIFWFKVMLAFWSLATIAFFWKLVGAITKKESVAVAATVTFSILSTLPLLEGNIANAENFMIGFTILGILILVTQKNDFKNLFISGVFFSIATLFKIPAAFDVLAVILFWKLTSFKFTKESILKFLEASFYLFIGFATPIAVSFLWAAMSGAFNDYLSAAFLQNVGYLSSWRSANPGKSFFERNATLLIRAGVMFLGFGLLWIKRKKLSQGFLLACLWLLTSLFAVTLSERPYPHYLLQSVPAISILVGFLASSTNIEQVLSIIPLALTLFVPVYYKFYYYPTASYYIRFIDFATGKTNKEEYFAKFDGNVNRNYKIADFISKTTKPQDKVFVWGDSPPIYALSRRLPPIKFVASYHIKDFSSQEEVFQALSKEKPNLIVILPESETFSELFSLISKNYILITSIENAEIYKLIETMPQSFLLGK